MRASTTAVPLTGQEASVAVVPHSFKEKGWWRGADVKLLHFTLYSKKDTFTPSASVKARYVLERVDSNSNL